MSGPASDWRRWTERRLASLKTTYAMPWTRWDPNPTPFSSLKVFKPKTLFGWLWTVWARISAYWHNGITPQAGPKLRPTRNARPQWDRLEREDGHGGKAGRLSEHANAIVQILPACLHEKFPAARANDFLGNFETAA